jgi:hypothetical protein
MAKRPSKDAWADARRTWEADPTETFESVSKTIGVSRVAVSKKASTEGWERVQSLHKIVEKAHLQADKVTPKLFDVSGDAAKSTVAAAIDIRADLLEKHREDWRDHRNLFTLEEIALEFDIGKSAKISAEMLTLRQKGERAAYGLDVEEPTVGALHEMDDAEIDKRINERLHATRAP